jgi:hypothetical protein
MILDTTAFAILYLTLRQHADQAILTTVSTSIPSCTAGNGQQPVKPVKSAQTLGVLSELTANPPAATIAAAEIRNATGTAISHALKTAMAAGSGTGMIATQTRNAKMRNV